MFEIVGISYPRNFAYGRFALRAGILQRPTLCHGVYLIGHIAFPLTLSPMVPLNLLDTKFQELKVL